MGVAYIICEKNLPAGVVLPDANHDWSTISVEDVRVGQWLLASIKQKKTNQMLSQFFGRNDSQFSNVVGTLPVLVIGVDARNSAVLCLHHDHDRSHIVSLWIHVNCLRVPELSIRPPAAAYERRTIVEQFTVAMMKSVNVLARSVMLQFFSLGEKALVQLPSAEELAKEHALLGDLQLPFVDVIRAAIVEEIVDDQIFGWIQTNGSRVLLPEDKTKAFSRRVMARDDDDSIDALKQNIKMENLTSADYNAPNRHPFKKLREIQHLLDWAAAEQKPLVSQLFDMVIANFKRIATTSNKFVHQTNIVSLAQNISPTGQVQASANSKPFKLCSFEGEDSRSIGAVVLAFHKDAFLGLYSGLKFFEDSLGIAKIG